MSTNRITKDIASEITKQMLSEKREKLQKLEEKRQDEINRLGLLKVPEEVIELHKKHPQYFNGSNSRVSLNGNYIGWVNSKIPSTGKSLFVEDQKSIFFKLDDQYNKLEEEINTIKLELEVTIFEFRTFKRLKEGFPEAAQHLPKEENKAVVSKNVPDLLNKLNNL